MHLKSVFKLTSSTYLTLKCEIVCWCKMNWLSKLNNEIIFITFSFFIPIFLIQLYSTFRYICKHVLFHIMISGVHVTEPAMVSESNF